MGQHPKVGRTPLLGTSAGCVEAPRSKALGYPQMNLSCCKLITPQVPGHPRGLLQRSRHGLAASSILVLPLCVSSPALQEHSVLSQPQLPTPSIDITFNDVQISSGHGDQSRPRHVSEGTWWLFVQGQQLRRREGRLLCPRSRHAGIDSGLFLSSRRSNNQIYFSCRSECRALLFILWL